MAAYAAGYMSAQVAAWYLKPIKRLPGFRPVSAQQSTLSNSAKYVLVRELTPANMSSIETWNVLKSLAASLSLLVLIGSLTFFIRYAAYHPWWWPIAGLVGGILVSLILAKEACQYERVCRQRKWTSCSDLIERVLFV